MSRTFIKEWVEKIDENNSITHRLKNGQEKIITSKKAFSVYSDDNKIIPCYKYSICDNQGKSFEIFVDRKNENKIYYKEIKSAESIVKTRYKYNISDKLELKTIETTLRADILFCINFETKYEIYKYFDLNVPTYMRDIDEYDPNTLKLIYEFHLDNNETVIMETIPFNKDYCKTTIKSEYEYTLLYNNNIIKTKVYNEKIHKENNKLITELIEFTIDKFTYKIINYTDKNKLKLIVKTNQEDELTLSERIFYDPINKDIDYFSIFAAIALRERTLLGIKEDNPEKYFFILLRDLEELIKFNFIIEKEDKKEEEIKEYEM